MVDARGMESLRCHGLPERLLQYRTAHKLSSAELARRAGITPQALHLIEKGSSLPTMETLERLSVATKLDPGWLGFGIPLSGTAPQITIAPGFDSTAMVEELLMLLKRSSCVIDDVYKYIDPLGAYEWRNVLRQPGMANLIADVPLTELGQIILGTVASECCDVIAIGCGTAEREINFVRKLLGRGRTDFRLLLIDISLSLLGIAVQEADHFSRNHAVPVLALLGDFHRMPDYAHLLTPDHPRRRILTMFGYTFANLDNEVQFLRRSLSWTNGGDYLILDLPAAATDSSDPSEIRRRDPGLAHKRGKEWKSAAFHFLMGPIRRYTDGVLDWEVTTELDQSSCLIPGSYAVVHRADVTLSSGERKKFVVGYSKRYHLEKLGRHMETEGWRLLEGLRYGPDDKFLLALFQRDENKTKQRRRAR